MKCFGNSGLSKKVYENYNIHLQFDVKLVACVVVRVDNTKFRCERANNTKFRF